MISNKKKSKKIERIQVCPKCNSPDISVDFSNAAAVSRGYFNVVKCNNCKHKGTFFPTVAIDTIKKVKRSSEVEDIQEMDLSFANGLFGVFSIVGGILLIVFGILLFYYSLLVEGLFPLLLGLLLLLFYFSRKKKKN